MHRRVVKINTDPPMTSLCGCFLTSPSPNLNFKAPRKNQDATMQNLLIFLESFPKDQSSLSDSSSVGTGLVVETLRNDCSL